MNIILFLQPKEDLPIDRDTIHDDRLTSISSRREITKKYTVGAVEKPDDVYRRMPVLEIESIDKAPSMDTEVPSLTCFEKGTIINDNAADEMPTLPRYNIAKPPPGWVINFWLALNV